MRAPRFRSLPLFWKILVPFMTLLLVVGVFGTFLIARTLASRAQNQLDQDLSRRALEVRSTLRDRELYLLESATLVANLEGMASAVSKKDVAKVTALVRSVLALKTDLNVVALVDRGGHTIVQIDRRNGRLQPRRDTFWRDQPIVTAVITSGAAAKQGGTVADMLAIAAPVCGVAPACAAAGVAVVGLPLDSLAAAAAQASSGASVALYGPDGNRLARSGPALTPKAAPSATVNDTIRRIDERRGRQIATLFAPYLVQGRTVGRIAVSIPSTPAFALARDAAIRLALLLVAAMGGVVALGALISRTILAQLKPLVEVNRALGAGDLTARAPVVADDELGELARGVNNMAEELQRSYNTLESRVAERTEEVVRLLRDRTDFFAAISHELRTPLAVIITQAEMMRDKTVRKNADWTTTAGKTIGESASQLLALVNEILDLARAEAGRLVLSPEELDLSDILTEMRSSVEGLARAGEIDVVYEVDPPLPVRGDAVRLREILLNLIDNAVKYTPPRGRITVSARALGRVVELAVADTGIGIPSECGDRIFEPFYRVIGSEPQRGEASSGLGLALTRHLVEAHGGTIAYTSELSQGTRFMVRLPALSRRMRPATRAVDRR